jgi:hypothetical protein
VACVVSCVDGFGYVVGHVKNGDVNVVCTQVMRMRAESEAKGVISSRKQRERDCRWGAAEVDLEWI